MILVIHHLKQDQPTAGNKIGELRDVLIHGLCGLCSQVHVMKFNIHQAL